MSGVGPDVLALPRGGGAVGGIGGGFAPDLNTGGGGYAVPLDLPQGVDGHTPQLTLQYGTAHGAGPFGLGWALSLPRVEVSTDGRLPAHDGTDVLVVPGAGPLVAVPGDPGAFVPETDGLGWRVRRTGDGFTVTDRSGLRHVLGTTPGARVADPADPGRVHAWLLERSVRPAGQEIAYTWAADGLLTDVRWAAYRLELHYEERPDPVLDGRAGFLRVTTRRCVAVELHAPAQAPSLLRRYTLDYVAGAPTGHSLLAGVTLSGHGADGTVEAFPRLAFTYTDGGGFGLRATGSGLAGVLAQPGGTLADLTGDGLPDAVLLGAVPAVAANRGGLAFDPPRPLGRAGLPGAPAGAATFVADLTGRGRVDLVTVGAGLRHRYPVDRGVVGRPVVDRYAPTAVPWDADVRLLDLDGDGATDLLALADGILTTVTSGAADAWDEVRRRVVADGDPLAGLDLRSPDVRVAPMGGDGLVDLVEVRNGSVRWWPNLGHGRWGAPVSMAGAPVLPAGYRPDRVLLVDLDGDGCADLVHVGTDGVHVWSNRGGTAFEAEVVVAPVPGVTVERIEPVDLRGTGCVGLLLLTRHGSRPAAYQLDLEAKPYLLDRVDDGLGHVTTIRYGTSTAQSRHDADAGRPWSTSLPFAVPVVTAVERTEPAGAPRVSTYRYHDGHWDPALRRFLGFAVVDEVEAGDETVEGLLRRTEFHLGRTPERTDRPATDAERVAAQVLRGRVVRSAGYRADADPDVDAPLFEVRQDWRAHVEDLGGAAAATPRLVERREDHLDGGGTAWRSTVTTTLAWDATGNVTEQVQRTVLAADPASAQEVRTVTAYALDPTGRVLDKAARVRQTDGSGAVVDDRVLRYDGPASEGLPVGEVGAGLLTHEERLVLRDDQVAAVYGADVPDLAALGHHRRAGEDGWWVHAVRYDRTVPGRLVARDPRGAPVTLELDAEHLFPARRTDARGNTVEATVDRRALRLASLTDGNGGVRRNTYDALGRLVAEHRPGDGDTEPTVVHTYLLGPAGPQVEVREHASADRTAPVTTRRLLDADGEETGVARRDGDGTWVVTEAQRRNARGLTARSYLPYRAPAAPDPEPPAPGAPHLATRFDALGRPVRVDLPGGGVRRGVHAPGRSDLWDEEDTRAGSPHEGTPTSFHLDGAGRVARVVHRLDGTEVVTTYRYDLRDQPVAVTDALGRTTTVTYDLLGRRVRVDDPSTGPVVLVHDAAGNVVERRNAAGQRARQEFDVLNRLVRATQDGGADVDHRYLDRVDVPGDAAPGRRVGRLASVTDARGTVTFDYDVRGEVEQRRVVLPDGTAYTLRRRTDRLGRVASITYPGAGDVPGPVLTYRYDARGMLTAVSGVVDAVDRDAAGNPVVTRFTGGVRTERTYDAMLRLATSRTLDAGGTVLLQEDLVRDLTGRVAGVTGLDPADTWAYEHDALGRLVRAAPGAGAVLELAYGPTGDVLHRSDVGAFAYGGAGAAPTAVTSAGPHTYGYDAAGRQTTGPAGAFTYDARDRLTSVTGAGPGAVTTTVTHGAFEEPAVREVTTGATTRRIVHLDDLVELHDGHLVLLVTDGTGPTGQLVPGGPVARWHTDHRGSVVLVTTGAGAVVQRLRYDPYGRLLSSLPGDRPRATYDGYDLLDEVGLYLSPRRPYDPVLGRYLVPDTVASDLWHPVGTNRYAYAADDPVTVHDPSGRAWWHVALAALAVVAVIVLTVVTFGAGLISLGAMIGVFAAMAVGGTVGGIAAAQAGGDVALGILLGAALAGAAALGGALAGAGFAASFGAKAFLTHVLSGAVSGMLLGAATGFAAGWAGGQGSLGDVWERTWQSALAGLATGIVFGVASYGFAQGWFGTGNIDPRLPTSAEVQRAAAEGARAAGQAGNAGATVGQAAGQGAGAAAGSLATSALNFGASSGFNVLQTFVFNPVAMTLLIESVSVLFAFDLVDDLADAIRDSGARASAAGTW
ncbi:toxin TcdB middle/N-terminal domain-containing protein [Cellulomonas shaoxiangyii]|uniref:Uncharacterized protein n=1 Tax=Cellulomonas shaoxiangyii TaxID=2566013 RepID=A0A4P7SH76_9CELL|nr:toxin TcdB middle/N-terminal domain-containing protein [Cellulomonas shaoxiangyii]QCB93559.1 hypothetical protein E5225_08285 [Cellulomonas shaoxiangyii]TGY86881.1 hypothetical protein E5226_00605 [Cellulomonas shaoxiangyii]